MIRLQVRVRGDGGAFRRLALDTVPTARTRLAGELRAAALQQIIATTPVRTGRARRGWADAAGDGDGSFLESGETGVSVRRATNHVPYVRFLEYGTYRMAPREIVRRALERIKQRATGMFSLTYGFDRRTGNDEFASIDGDSFGDDA